MMNVSEMSDQEKSVLLARAMAPDNGVFDHTLNLYDPANMPLAWKVLNWIGTQGLDHIVATWFQEFGCIHLAPSLAQRAWLDKVLSLAIEAGLVEVE